jgi:hypothetical protein
MRPTVVWGDPDGWRPARDDAFSASILKRYKASDFEDLPPELRDPLRAAVRSFKAFARSLSEDEPVSDAEYSEGERLLKDVVDPVKRIVLSEWRKNIETLIKDAEQWSTDKGWLCRRETKTFSESLLEAYELPRLLVYADVAHVLVEPVARFVAGAFGLAEISVIPSYASLRVPLAASGWQVRIPESNGTGRETVQSWSKPAFLKAVDWLLRHA